MRPVITACLLAGVTLLLYGYRLTNAPAHPQELLILRASAPGPLFFRVADDQWLQPVAVYSTAMARAIGGGDASARLATVMAAALSVGLIYLAARRAFESQVAVFAAPLLLLATPAHITFARSGTDAIFSIPFALMWLIAMHRYWVSDSPTALALAGASLGAGVYANRAAPLTMAFLLAVAVAAVLTGGRKWRAVITLVAAFGALLIPAAAWFALHPDTYADTFGRWAIFLAHVRYPLEGLRAFLNWNTLGNRVSLYWGFLDPAWLFFEGMLLLVMLPLLLAGIALWRHALSRHSMILIAGGALVAPLAGSSFGEAHYAQDALAFLPFSVLLMAAGAAGLWRWQRAQRSRA